ncbi:hypothetical protein NE852_14140 [Rhizobium sp. Pop5]|uniref:hypothetical protein n=1 Tax=Rhizobium sp. Pop5 TaxID=1223565 RepID=UPI0013E305DA|nr:hypothetical protein [Rhizobium sp. Pop5]UVD55242.1 hypothetical protein NE852_14140 [Rhizobium sp. Pop5]
MGGVEGGEVRGRDGKLCGNQKGEGTVSDVSPDPAPIIRRIIPRRWRGLDPLSLG